MKKNMFYWVLVVVLFSFITLSGCSKNDELKSNSNAESEGDTISSKDNEDVEENKVGQEEAEIYVFVAASLSNAMGEIQDLYLQVKPNVTLLYNADSSGTLQTQIEEGAECDVYFSAAMNKMTALDEGGYIINGSIKKLLENMVVLIKPKDGETKVTGFENVFEASSLALAGEDVPAGAYGREIFKNLEIWDRVEVMEINEGANVTAVLAAISEASNEVGVVYATDANSVKDSVDIIANAPEGSLNTPVIYPVGLVKNQEADEIQLNAAKDFIEYLSSEEAIAVFEEYGFTIYIE